jgi:tRNA-dihydrouridine synthase
MLAPMAELSHRALRELIEGFGPGACDEYYTEMISAPALFAGGPFEKWYLDSGPCPERLVYQLVGADTGRLVRAAALLDRRECLGIDINMGCAAPAITRTGAGVRWMEDIDRAGKLIAAVRGVTKKRLSVKLRIGPKSPRLGSKSPPESGTPGLEYLIRFCRRLEEAGVELITLHPRGAGDKFKRSARWEYVSRLREAGPPMGGLGIPVAGNGDIGSAEALAAKAEEGPAMAGRLAVRQPWVFAEVKKALGAKNFYRKVEKVEEGVLEETALRFLDLLALYQPPEFHLSRARRFFRYYCDNFTWAEYLRNKINREETLTGIAAVISGYCRKEAS